MRELAIQAANDTLTAEDRKLIQQEINETVKGIDQIASNTEFNTIKLLNGTNPYPTTTIVGEENFSFNYANVLKTTAVDSNGSFTFGTNEGYPTTDADNNKTLVYGSGGTSMPSVRIGGESFQLRTNTSSATVVTDGVHKTIYTILDKNVEVIQFVSIVKDKYEIKYTITNTGSDKNSIGFQFHLDTMLGNDDSAPFIVDASKVTKQTVYSGDDIPIGFTVYNQDTGTLSNADFQAGGIIKGEGIIENPSQLAIGNYSLVDDWDFNSNTGAVGDSGYSLWWDLREINSGESFTINTFFGQSVPPTIQDPTKSSGDGPFDLLLQVGANTNQ